jgi:DNA-binding winged helix-turn-helix (wHTH) protein
MPRLINNIPLTPKAFDLLLLLIQNSGGIVTKDELMKGVWPNSFVEECNRERYLNPILPARVGQGKLL